jgi:hypothetical protein
MGIIRRSPQRHRGNASRDVEYAFFSVDDGARFRAQVREAFAEQGLEVTVHAGTVSDDAGRQFGLHNLAALCYHEPRGRKSWPQLIRRHVSLLMRVIDGPSPLESLAPDQLLARLRPWVIARDFLEPDTDRYNHAGLIAPGLCEVLALDLHESVEPLPDTSLAQLGDIADLRIRALSNLRALPVESHTILQGPEEIHFDVVTGDSFFTSSRVLALNELTHDLTGRSLGPDGALVAMPNRHHLAFRRLDTVRNTSLIPTLHGMAVFTAANFEEAVGPVSPDVYWWHEGALTRILRQKSGYPARLEALEFEVLQMRLADNGAQ